MRKQTTSIENPCPECGFICGGHDKKCEYLTAYTANTFGIRRVVVMMHFEHAERTFYVYQENNGDYTICDYITGYSAHTDPKLEKCVQRAKAKIDKAIAANFNWNVYPKLNDAQNVAAFERIEALIYEIEKASKINMLGKIKIKFK